MIKVMSIFGTRPEAVKMCPLVQKLEKHPDIQSIVCLSGQHREMLGKVMDIFAIKPQYDLDIMRPGQTLTTITTRVLEKFEQVLRLEQPNLVLVHGDTSTSFAAALAAFYQHIPVGHVEAGLRTYDKYSPFPEEMNRNLTAKIAELHFAPTEQNKENLRRERIEKNVFVTGNTVMDAFQTTIHKNYVFENSTLRQLHPGKHKTILVTAHRRENLGRPLEQICRAVRRLAIRYRQMQFVYPVHLNPAVRSTAESILAGIPNAALLSPLDVQDMHNLLSRSYLVLTDSGGLQEEAPAFGVPVLVLRTETERPEAVAAGTVKVAGVQEEDIVREASRLIDQPAAYEAMAKAVNPYGDGHACERIVQRIMEWQKGM